MTPYYDQGGITIYHGNCRDFLPQLEPVDHILTDPPYARDVYARLRHPHPSAKVHKGQPRHSPVSDPRVGALLGIRNDQYSSTSIEKLAAGFIGEVDELIEPCSVEFARLTRRWAVVFSDAESTHRWRSTLEVVGMRYVRTGAWVKPDAMPQFSGDRPSVGFEPCTIVHAQGAMRWNGGGRAALWTYNTVKGKEARPDHPCPKPLALMRELVSLFSDPGEMILDPFMGSGTTLRAAKDLGRRAVGIEIEERYCEIAAKRLSQEVFDMEPATIATGSSDR
jgi:site-specific DNA-methyltransferase (adenine-specific)